MVFTRFRPWNTTKELSSLEGLTPGPFHRRSLIAYHWPAWNAKYCVNLGSGWTSNIRPR